MISFYTFISTVWLWLLCSWYM